jgi:nickel-dependent lactate racemase
MKSLFSLPYGKSHIQMSLEDNHTIELIEPEFTKAAIRPLEEVASALKVPLGSKLLEEYARCKSVAIAINDKTRPVPYKHLLPPLLRHLSEMGIQDESITFFIATGTHIPMKAEEYPTFLPDEIIQKYKIVSHDCDDAENLLFKKRTKRNTPIYVNKAFYHSELKILIGNIEPHHFAGYSGGYKTAAIGLCSRQTINSNHSMLVDPNSTIAEYNNNPLRQDINEIGEHLAVQFALNAVLNSDKEIVRVFFGHPMEVMKAGIPVSTAICQTKAKVKADLVIASVGGHPKDINLYQSQKALTHGALVNKDGGVVILVAACPEGSGSMGFEKFMSGLTSPQEALVKFMQQEFQVGPHKAFQFARELIKRKVILVSQMDKQLVERLLLGYASNINDALEMAESSLPKNYSIAVLPHATNTIPDFS